MAGSAFSRRESMECCCLLENELEIDSYMTAPLHQMEFRRLSFSLLRRVSPTDCLPRSGVQGRVHGAPARCLPVVGESRGTAPSEAPTDSNQIGSPILRSHFLFMCRRYFISCQILSSHLAVSCFCSKEKIKTEKYNACPKHNMEHFYQNADSSWRPCNYDNYPTLLASRTDIGRSASRSFSGSVPCTVIAGTGLLTRTAEPTARMARWKRVALLAARTEEREEERRRGLVCGWVA
jgi:hypothetical protein